VHPVVPALMWLPTAGFLLWRSLVWDRSIGVLQAMGVGGFALISWTLTEYLLHRYFFHFKGEKPWQRRLQFLFHGLHHDDPVDPTRLVMPPVVALILGGAFYTLFRSTLGLKWGEPFFAFFVLGYLWYDYTHYAIHCMNVPLLTKTRVGKMLKKNHMLHHFSNDESRWGVSSPLWDLVFKTNETPPGVLRAGNKKLNMKEAG